MIEHVVYTEPVERRPGYVRGRCECGWLGTMSGSIRFTLAEAELHLLESAWPPHE